MSQSHSRIPRFYKFSVSDRLRTLLERRIITEQEYDMLMDSQHVLETEQADRLIENVIATFGLPMGLGLNFLINDREHLVPMVVEEPSIVAAVSSIAKIVRQAGGFTVQADRPRLIGQIQIVNVPDPDQAQQSIMANQEEILNLANSLHPNMVARGGGADQVEVFKHGATTNHGQMLVVHLRVDTCDAMGANMVNTMCEGTAPLMEKLTGGKVFLRILSNLADQAMVRARAVIPPELLADQDYTGEQVRDGIILANEFAEIDPYRATTHNKGIMNGIDAVAIATGNDWRAIEASAHAYAARHGRYQSLTRWSADAKGQLVGELELPLKVGTVGGQIQANPAAKLAYRLLGTQSAVELAEVMCAVGLAQNFAAIKALSTEGIQSGHMTLHARSVAMAAGATQDQFDEVVERLVASGDIKVWRAQQILADLNTTPSQQTAASEATAATAPADYEPARPDIGQAETGYGKIILLGEHSVVYGRYALAAPIPLDVQAEVQPQDNQQIDLLIPRWSVEMRLSEPEGSISSLHESIKLITEQLGVADRGMRIEVFPRVPRANGLGASAALAVAVIRAIARCFAIPISEQYIAELSFEVEKIAHGTPSGLDNTLATYGKPIQFRKTEPTIPPEITHLEAGRPIPVVIGLTGVVGLTAKTVGSVRAAWQNNPARYEAIFDQIDALARAGSQALKRGDIAELGELMNLNQGLLNALQVSSKELEDLINLARRHGALGAKMTGSGGGGAMIAIAEPDKIEAIAVAMRSAGYNSFITEIQS